ncbi:MAG: hypothetical protein HYZ65_08785 [Burkholderiales bacterium]|nr:hypothetical protein [Burkholderiales bacterium]
MGFTLAFDNNNNQPQSCIQKIAFTDGMLAIRTASDNSSLSSFTLTLYLRVTSGVDYLQGYCTLNNEANVMVYLGSQRAVEWRNGRISAVLRGPESRFRGVLVSVFGAAPGNKISMELSTKKGLGLVNWCLGPAFSESSGIMLTSANGTVPLASMSYANSHLVFEIAQNANASAAMDFVMATYITWEPVDLPYLYLKASCDSNVSMYAHVGNRQPQLVSQTYTVFTL